MHIIARRVERKVKGLEFSFQHPQGVCRGLFNEKREEEQVSLASVDDIFEHAERLRATVAMYLVGSDANSKE